MSLVVKAYGKSFRSREIDAHFTSNKGRHVASLVPDHRVDLLNEETTRSSVLILALS